MSFPLIKYLLVAGIYLTCYCMSQQIGNNTLIYDYDVNHKINLYCQFASQEELKSIERKCLEKNKEMQHILADGTKTFPYAPYGSSAGFILKCGKIPYGKLKPPCSRYLYTNCSYTCDTSLVVHSATCSLVGPWDNVNAQWSLTETCTAPRSVPHISSGFSGPSSTPLPENEVPAWRPVIGIQSTVASANGNAHNVALSNGTASNVTPASKITSNVTSANGVTSVTFSSGDTSEDMTPVVVGGVVTGFVIVLVVFLSVCLCKRRRTNKRQPNCPAHLEECNGHCQTTPEDLQQEPTAVEDICQQLPSDPLIESVPRAFTDLPGWRSLTDYNYSENNNTCKGVADKNPLEELNKCSNLNLASLDGIFVQDMSGTVSYGKTSHVFAANPDICNATVQLLKEQTNSYRKWLRAELEVLPGRSREQALVGYVEENAQSLGYMPNEIKLLEKSYETQVEEKVSDEFLHRLAAYGVKIGSIVKYFYLHGNSEAITAITQVHKDCPFCGQLRRL